MIKFLRAYKTVDSHLNSEKSALVTYRGSEFIVSSQNGHDDGPFRRDQGTFISDLGDFYIKGTTVVLSMF